MYRIEIYSSGSQGKLCPVLFFAHAEGMAKIFHTENSYTTVQHA